MHPRVNICDQQSKSCQPFSSDNLKGVWKFLGLLLSEGLEEIPVVAPVKRAFVRQQTQETPREMHDFVQMFLRAFSEFAGRVQAYDRWSRETKLPLCALNPAVQLQSEILDYLIVNGLAEGEGEKKHTAAEARKGVSLHDLYRVAASSTEHRILLSQFANFMTLSLTLLSSEQQERLSRKERSPKKCGEALQRVQAMLSSRRKR
jgi:hypothetical protein